MRLLLATLESVNAARLVALRNLVDIIKALMQSSSRDFQLSASSPTTAHSDSYDSITVLGVVREWASPCASAELVARCGRSQRCLRGKPSWPAATQRRAAAHVLRRSVQSRSMTACRLPRATLRRKRRPRYVQTYRVKQLRCRLLAGLAGHATANDPIEIQPRISTELSDLADAALEGASRHRTP